MLILEFLVLIFARYSKVCAVSQKSAMAIGFLLSMLSVNGACAGSDPASNCKSAGGANDCVLAPIAHWRSTFDPVSRYESADAACKAIGDGIGLGGAGIQYKNARYSSRPDQGYGCEYDHYNSEGKLIRSNWFAARWVWPQYKNCRDDPRSFLAEWRVSPQDYEYSPYMCAYCPFGTKHIGNGNCKKIYTSVFSKIAPQLNCKVGNPIEVSTGAKVQEEAENLGFLDLPFLMSYSSHNTQSPQWRNNFQRSLQPFDPNDASIVLAKSGSYNSPAEACAYGWQEIQTKITDRWAQNANASYKCGRCEVIKNNTLVATLIVATDASPEAQVGDSKQEALRVKREDGSEWTFIKVISDCGSPIWQASNGNSPYSLATDANGNFQLTEPGGAVERFDSTGRLQSITTLGGQVQTLAYDPISGNLNRVTNADGRHLEFEYTQDRLTRVVTNTGKATSFEYSGNGLINKVNHSDNTSRRYHYEDPSLPTALTGITDERGIRYATWKYDEKGRAISSEHAGGAEKTSLAFNADGSTTVTNALGKKTTYSFADILGVRRVTNVTGEPTATCVGANQAYTYTPQGLVETKTDWNGGVTKYTYDNLGRELTRTQAYGTPDAKTVQTCWHATLNEPARIVEPTKITQFDYTATGQLKSQTVKPRPAGAVNCSISL